MKWFFAFLAVLVVSVQPTGAQVERRDDAFSPESQEFWKGMLNTDGIELTAIISNPEMRALLACEAAGMKESDIRYKKENIGEYNVIFGGKGDFVYVYFLPVFVDVPGTKYKDRSLFPAFECYYSLEKKSVSMIKIEK
ncbi:MAG: hypothetical protein ACOY99_10840 [Pseudomonadota bacterium]